LNAKVAVAEFPSWSYDLSTAPRGTKMLLLTVGHVAVVGNYVPGCGFLAWAHLPKRDKIEEKKRGLDKMTFTELLNIG
jgi:hypothetical protein